MTCEECDDLLWPLAAGELEDGQMREVTVHVEQCTSCQDRLDEVRRLAAAAKALPHATPSRSLCLQTKEAVRLELERLGRVRHAFGPVMNADDVAKYLKVTVETVYRHLDEIPHFELEGQMRFRRESLDRWIESSERAQTLFGRVVRAVG